MISQRFGRRMSALLLLAVSATGTANAATQGNLGATSTGSVVINASVPSRVMISGLSDVSFLNQDPTVAASNAQNVCVWSNTATKGYKLTATGDGTGTSFKLKSGALAEIPYSVQWAATTGQTTGSALTSGTQVAGLTSTATKSDCSSGPAKTASLIVGITAANLQDMQAGPTYTGLLTLVVAPE